MGAATIPHRAVPVTKSDTNYITDQIRSSVVEAAVLTTSVVVATDTITQTAHGYANGDTIKVTDNGTTDLTENTQVYYLINVATNTYKLSTTLGGSAVNIGGTDDTPPTIQRLTSLAAAQKVIGSLTAVGAGNIVALPQSHADTDDPTVCVGGAQKFYCPAGGVVVGHFKKVFSTGTDATDITCQYE